MLTQERLLRILKEKKDEEAQALESYGKLIEEIEQSSLYQDSVVRELIDDLDAIYDDENQHHDIFEEYIRDLEGS